MCHINSVRYIAVAVLALWLSACGYHLRGTQDADVSLAFASVYIVGGSQDSAFLARFKQRLHQLGISEADSQESADLVVLIDEINQSRRVLSVDAGARVSEFELYYLVGYRLRQGEQTSQPRQASSRRDITFDQNRVLAKAEEESRFYEEMRADAINSILRAMQRYRPGG